MSKYSENDEKIKEADNQKTVFSSISGATGGAAIGYIIGGPVGGILGALIGGTFSGVTEYKIHNPNPKKQ